jgi:hypothetical protein
MILLKILVSDIMDSNVSLRQEIELLWQGFQFFYGSFQLLLKNCKERNEAQQRLKKYAS